jgi:hypothetical protein
MALTPWLIDIVPQNLAESVRCVNRLLKKGGVWLNTGSLAFFHRNEAWCYGEEEALELIAAGGFEVLVASASHLLKARIFAAIDGKRSIDEIAFFIAKRYGLQRSEAKGAVERIPLEVYETSPTGSRDRLRELE